MEVAIAVVAFVPGLALGSFLNVVAARVPLRRSIVHPGSACMSCGTALAWYDNVPLVSFALLRGRCRHCGVGIPWRYPGVEAATALHPSVEWLAGGLGASLFLFIAALAYPAGMGMGDVKLALLLGVGLGRTVPVAMLSGMLAALVPSVVLFARHGSAARKMAIPFGPFLALGGVLALFAGHAILHGYVGLTR